ncbi:MAG TPA: hypothetical protein VGY77_09140 [Gemmataceae bacterium]|nr:hypothetical protein [Gemmataceae bacterium]
MKGKPVSPGEFLWLMVGMQQLTLLISVLVRFEPAPRLSGWDQQWTLWFLPCLVGNLTCGFGVIKFWRFWPWQVFFAIIFSFFILFTLDSRIPHYHRAAEESFITAVSPTLLGFAGVATAWISHSWKNYPARDERAIFHWVGILVCLLPFFWFAVCLFLGLVHPRELSVRIRE